jgi:hypothetical protein
MAKKDALFGKLLVSAEDLSSSFESEYFRIKYLDNLLININCYDISDNLGSFTIYHRIVKDDDLRSYSDWCALDFGEELTLSGDASDTFLININQIAPGELKINFDPSGASPIGGCDIWISGSGLGG